MLSDDEVKVELDRFVIAELWTDRERPEDKENARLLVEEFRGESLPLYVVLRPDGTEIARIAGMATKTEFLAFLRSSLAPGN